MKSKPTLVIYLLIIIGIISFSDRSGFLISPVKAAVFFAESFETGSPQTFLSQSYGNISTSSRYSIQSAVRASGMYGLRYHFMIGTSNVGEYTTQHFGDSPAGPVHPNGAGNHYNDIYIQFKLYYSLGYDWSAGNNKIMIIGTQDDRNHDNVCCNPWVSHYITILAGNAGPRGFFDAEGNNKISASGQWFGLSPNINGYDSLNRYFINPGRWYTIEVHKRLNDVGMNNGIFEVWINGLKVAEYFTVTYRVPWDGTYGTNFAYGTNFVMLTTYINNPAPRDQDIYYDDVKFSTTYIGTTSVPLSPPTGLRIIN